MFVALLAVLVMLTIRNMIIIVHSPVKSVYSVTQGCRHRGGFGVLSPPPPDFGTYIII